MADYSIPIRMRRVITETAYVEVPLTPDLMRNVVVDAGHAAVDPGKLIEAAMRLSREESVVWEPDGDPLIEPHPIQTQKQDKKGDSPLY